jgi:hypothetical protein
VFKASCEVLQVKEGVGASILLWFQKIERTLSCPPLGQLKKKKKKKVKSYSKKLSNFKIMVNISHSFFYFLFSFI